MPQVSNLRPGFIVYCGGNLEQLGKFLDACVDLTYIDPPFTSNRNYEVFWGETKEKRSSRKYSVLQRRLNQVRIGTGWIVVPLTVRRF